MRLSLHNRLSTAAEIAPGDGVPPPIAGRPSFPAHSRHEIRAQIWPRCRYAGCSNPATIAGYCSAFHLEQHHDHRYDADRGDA
jgi:hypothetical protein